MTVSTEVVRDAPHVELAPIDTSVVIPEHVKRQAAAAEAYYQTQTPTPASEAPTPAPAPAPEPPTTSATPAPAPATPDAAEWENRYKAMKGRYDQSQGQIGELQQQLTQMGNELFAVQRQISAPAPVPTQRLITEQEEKDYGAEFLGVVKKAAQEEFSPVVDGLKQQVTTLQERLAQKAQQDIWGALDAALPDWRTINRSPAFINWLSLRDTYSNKLRRVLLNDAFQAADAPRVLSFFRGFVTDEAATGPAPQPAARQPAVSLEALAAPGRAQSSPAPAAGEKPVFTVAQIREFYDASRRGVYLGRETEKNQIEQAIFAAQREGRVRG